MRILIAVAILTFSSHAHARDQGQWTTHDPGVVAWYQALKQPDNPESSCCGEADAYWADDLHVRNGKVYAVITDPRPDEPLGRQHREIGEEYEIPDKKMKGDQGNPTGHAIIFLTTMGITICYVPNTGT